MCKQQVLHCHRSPSFDVLLKHINLSYWQVYSLDTTLMATSFPSTSQASAALRLVSPSSSCSWHLLLMDISSCQLVAGSRTSVGGSKAAPVQLCWQWPKSVDRCEQRSISMAAWRQTMLGKRRLARGKGGSLRQQKYVKHGRGKSVAGCSVNGSLWGRDEQRIQWGFKAQGYLAGWQMRFLELL